jgi:hypothetical protein
MIARMTFHRYNERTSGMVARAIAEQGFSRANGHGLEVGHFPGDFSFPLFQPDRSGLKYTQKYAHPGSGGPRRFPSRLPPTSDTCGRAALRNGDKTGQVDIRLKIMGFRVECHSKGYYFFHQWSRTRSSA